MNRLRQWVQDHLLDKTCPYCGAFEEEDCTSTCPTRKCPECGGLGIVIDLGNPLGVSDDDGVLYGGKPCPRGCSES